jgi:hypothetical protein
MVHSGIDTKAKILIDGELGKIPLREISTDLLLRCDPVREFQSRRGQSHFPGRYWSATDGKHIPYESQFELARLRLADFDPDVVAIRSQPFRLIGSDDEGRNRRPVPDFALLHADGLVEIVNVKPAERMKKPKVRDDLAWAHVELKRHGFATEIWTGAPGPVLVNVRFLAGYRNPALFDAEQLASVRTLVRTGTVESIEAVLRANGVDNPRPLLMHLIWRGDLRFDISQILDHTTTLEEA